MFDFISFFPRAVMQGIPLLYGSTGETLTEKSGNLNLGIPGVMYVGAICGVIGAFFYEHGVGAENMKGFLAIGIPLVCSLLGSLLMGLLYCFLTVTLRANQNVMGLALTTFGVGVGNFFGGSLIKLTGSEVPSIALSGTSHFFSRSLPFAADCGVFGQMFLSYGFLAYAAIIIALVCSYVLKRTRIGLQLRAVGESRAALAGHYVLGADITLTAPWKPIGSRLAPFTGSFDGNGHVIRGLSVPRSGPGAGMFGFARGARITGVALEGATIRGGCLLPIVARGHGNTVTACSINEPRDAQRVLPTACGAAAL